MEKVLLIMALLGSAHLAFRGMVKFGKLAFSFAAPKANIHPDTVRMPEVKPMAIRKDGEEDWSQYDIPAFIRRGIPMPKLEPVQAKSEAPAVPAAPDTAAFEIVA